MRDPADLAALAALFAGTPVVGGEEQAFVLATVAGDGWPHAAIVSRAEVDVDEAAAEVRVVVRGRRTGRALRDDGRALLVAVAGGAALHVRLRVARVVEDGGMTGVACTVERIERDAAGVDLQPMRYAVTEALPVAESWPAVTALLRSLSGGG